MKPKKKALGRGLDAILQSPETDITSKDISGNYVIGAIANLKTASIETNPFQPRGEFDEVALEELCESIKAQGIIQPITVRKMGYDNYQLISGERRLRAAKALGLIEIPSYIRVANDEQMLELALIENTHREDLNAIEIAISYQRLIEECSVTQEALSEKIGKKRTTISNYIRLLKLPAEVQIAIKDGQITMGHARTLINLPDDENKLRVLKRIIENDLSVRQVEDICRDISKPKTKKIKIQIPEHVLLGKERLIEQLGTKVDVKTNNKGAGSILISFDSETDFERILTLLQ
jgi:ParB family chromosome partitioning protein